MRPASELWALLIVGTFAVLLAAAAPATADRTFTTRFSTNDTGAITFAANTVMTCPAVAPTCAQAQAVMPIASGSNNFDNNNFNMTYANTAPGTVGGTATFDSSSAQMTLPAGASVLWAGLYWGGDTSAGASSGIGPAPAQAPSASARGQVGFQVPSAAGYTTITGSVDVSSSNTTRYSAFANVTSLVAAAGSGNYSVANVQAGTGEDRYGGWALFVVYHDPSDPPRNLTVDDGLVSVAANSPPTTIALSGFKTPPAGPVNTTVGFLAWEGDTGLTGDTASLDGATTNSADRPPQNFFNGGISAFGANVTTRNPAYQNNFAIDAGMLSANGVIPNGATSATVQLTTSGDAYYPAVVSFATELYAPVVTGTKTVKDLTHPNGPDEPGDVLQYTVSYTNTGQDTAKSFVLRDPIPGGSTYVPGSLRITAGPQAGSAPTDASGDDTGEYDSQAGAVVFRLGSGATATSGGTVVSGETDTVTFQVRIDPSDLNGQQIANQADATFTGLSLGGGYDIPSPQATTTVQAPDLTILKSHAGELVGGEAKAFAIDVANVGGAPTDGSPVTVTDQLPASSFDSVTGASGNGWSCVVMGLAVTCTRSDVLAAGSTYPPIELDVMLAPSPPGSVVNTATVSGGGDTNPANNNSTDIAGSTQLADLSIAKSAQPSTVYSGNQVTYTLTVTNSGPSPASEVTVEDPLGSSYSQVSMTTTQGSCDQTVSCSLGEMPSFATATITITATVLADDTTLHNTATVSSLTADPNTSNDTASADVTVPPTADLAITKAGTGSAPQAGQPYTYTIGVSNRGPDTAEGVVVTDDLPSQFTATSATGGGFSCQLPGSAGGTLVCTRSLLAVAEGTQQITVVGTFAVASAAQEADNVATVSAQTADPEQSNNVATVSLEIGPAADLILGKSAVLSTTDPTPLTTALSPGETFAYYYTIINNGPDEATAVKLADPLPTGIVGEAAGLPAGCEYEAGTNEYTCTVATLAAGASTTLALPAKVTPTNPGGNYTNTATVSSAVADPDLTSNTASALVGVTPVADLQLTKFVSSTSASVGETVTFTLTATNLGPDATGAAITDPLPSGLTFAGSSQCSFAAPDVTCDVGALAAGASQTVSFAATVTSAAAGTTITNAARIASEDAGPEFPQLDDFYPPNNSASAVLPVEPQADVSLAKTVSNANPSVGELVTYTLTAANAGPSPATAVTIVDPIPAGLGFVSASPGCTNVAGTLTCLVGGLAAGGQASVGFSAWVLDAAAGSTITNLATVSGEQPDPDAANNQASATIEVPPSVDLRLTKVASSSTPPAGGQVTYTLTVANDGPSTATGVTLSDPLPAGLTYQSASAAQGSCAASGGVVSCSLGSLPPGGATLVTITAGVGSDTAGTSITNTASVSAAEHNASQGLSSARATITPAAPAAQPDAKLTLTKTVDHRRARFGTKLSYTIEVANAGPATAQTPTVTDTFSAATSILSAHASTGACHGHDPLTCRLASIAPGKRTTITVLARARDLGKLRNTASVATPTPLATGSRTIAQATTIVLPGPHSRLLLRDRTSTPTLRPGGVAVFMPKVSNPNPWPLHHVEVCDRLPKGVMFFGGSVGARQRGRLVCWTIATLSAHGSRTVWVHAETLPGAVGVLRDAATATAIAGNRRLRAHAHAHVLVLANELCGSIARLRRLRRARPPVAVAAC